MQEVVITDKLVMVDEPEGTLMEFIESALDNRNEIKGAAIGARTGDFIYWTGIPLPQNIFHLFETGGGNIAGTESGG